MYVAALLFAAVAVSHDSLEIERDVYEIQELKFAIPIRVDPKRVEQIAKIRLFVSQDRGKSWKHVSDFTTEDDHAPYAAQRDGSYWFSVQVVMKNGEKEPPDHDKLSPSMKVFVNSKRRVLKAQKSYEELQREVEDLRKTVEELKRKLAERDAAGKGK